MKMEDLRDALDRQGRSGAADWTAMAAQLVQLLAPADLTGNNQADTEPTSGRRFGAAPWYAEEARASALSLSDSHGSMTNTPRIGVSGAVEEAAAAWDWPAALTQTSSRREGTDAAALSSIIERDARRYDRAAR